MNIFFFNQKLKKKKSRHKEREIFFKGEINHANSNHKSADKTALIKDKVDRPLHLFPQPGWGFLVPGSALSKWTHSLGKLQAGSRLFRMTWHSDSMSLAPGPMHGLPSLQVRGVLWPTLNQVSLTGQTAGSQEMGLPEGPAGSACHNGHQGACWLLYAHGDVPPAHVLPFRLSPGPSQDSGLGEHAGE